MKDKKKESFVVCLTATAAMSTSVKSLRLKRALKIGQITKKNLSLFKKFLHTPPLKKKTIMYDAIYFIIVALVEFFFFEKIKVDRIHLNSRVFIYLYFLVEFFFSKR